MWFWSVAFIVSTVCCSGCYGDFALPYTIPGLDGNFRSNVGQGIMSFVKANASAKFNATADHQGAVVVLYEAAESIISPLNRLLGEYSAALGDQSGDVDAVVARISEQVEPTNAALDKAIASFQRLSVTTRPSTVAKFIDRATEVKGQVTELSLNLGTFAGVIKTVLNSEPPLASNNVTTVITPEALKFATEPVRRINEALTRIGEHYDGLFREKRTAIAYEQATNKSASAALTNLMNYVNSNDRTFEDAMRAIERQTVSNLRQINESYASSLSRTADRANQENLGKYLNHIDAIGRTFNANTASLLTEMHLNFSSTLTEFGAAITGRLYNLTLDLASMGALSDSAHNERCMQRYMPDFRPTAHPLTKLTNCGQTETRTLGYLGSLASPVHEQSRYAAQYATLLSSICSPDSNECIAQFIDTLPEQSSAVEAKFQTFADLIALEGRAMSRRLTICTAAADQDVLHYTKEVAQKFNSCLESGV